MRLPLGLMLLVLACALAAAGCGREDGEPGTRSGSGAAPVLGAEPDGDEPAADEPAGEAVPAPADPGLAATKNTSRIPGADPVAVAAGVARAVFPSGSPDSRPAAVVLVDRRDWRAALAAAVLAADPVRAPVLYADGPGELPAATRDALAALRPRGSRAAGGAQVVRIGRVPRPSGLRTTDLAGADAFALARAVDAFVSAARGRTAEHVLVVGAEAPAFALPAAAYAAKSGDPVLFAGRDRVPAETRAALRAHEQPRITVLGPPEAVGARAVRELRRLGTVTRVSGDDPQRNAVAFARFLDQGVGWGVVDPGHGVVLARGDGDPAMAAAAAPLSASGTYGPLLLTAGAGDLGAPLESFLRDIRPGYTDDPVRGVYNHGWLVGDAGILTPGLQARLDSLLEIMPVSQEEVTTP
jgi:hypothetical protein